VTLSLRMTRGGLTAVGTGIGSGRLRDNRRSPFGATTPPHPPWEPTLEPVPVPPAPLSEGCPLVAAVGKMTVGTGYARQGSSTSRT
jgi:hypothetical protein